MNKWRAAAATFTFLIILNPCAASASSRAECNVVKSAILGHSVRYCALLPESFERIRPKDLRCSTSFAASAITNNPY